MTTKAYAKHDKQATKLEHYQRTQKRQQAQQKKQKTSHVAMHNSGQAQYP